MERRITMQRARFEAEYPKLDCMTNAEYALMFKAYQQWEFEQSKYKYSKTYEQGINLLAKLEGLANGL